MGLMDTDDDQNISLEEWREIHGTSRASDVEFMKMDADRSGGISANELAAEEVSYLECTVSSRACVVLAALFLFDFANIINPIVNATPVQQGEMLWASKHLQLVDLLGYVGVKLELALIPSLVSFISRVLIGDDDTDTEVFLYQLGILVCPIVLGKLGYGFELNTSTLLLLAATVLTACRATARWMETPMLRNTFCTDDTNQKLQDQYAEEDPSILEAALG
jgi:hypothetical protein